MSDYLYECQSNLIKWGKHPIFDWRFMDSLLTYEAWSEPKFYVRVRDARLWLVRDDLAKAVYAVVRDAQPRHRDQLMLRMLKVSDEWVYSNGP